MQARQTPANFASRFSTDFLPVTLIIVLINFTLFFVSGSFVRSVAERLVLGQAAHTDPDRLFLWFDLEWPLGRFQHFAHITKY
jgi:hypothetical protein